MVTCQSANQLKTPAKAFLSLQNGLSSWFIRLHNHGENCWSDSCPEDNHWHPSQGGKATNIHCQRSWLFTECCIQSCFPMLTESWVERQGVEEKDAQPTERTAALWGLSSKNYSRIWVNFTRNGLRLGSRHQEPPHTDVSRNLATVIVRGVLPGLRRRRTGLLPSGPKSSFQMRVSFVFHLETKVLESGGRVEKLITQVAWSPVLSFHSLWWFGVQCHLLVLVHCVFWKPTSLHTFTNTFLEHSRFLPLTSFLKMLISFSSRIWHLSTLPKAPKVG